MLKSVALYIVAMLVIAWMWGQVLEYVSWKVRARRMWRNIEREITKGQ